MAAPGAPARDPEPPLRISVDGVGLVACIDALLAIPTSVTAVEARVVRSIGQGGDDVWLGFVTYHPSRGWERNGLAAEAPGIGAGRRIVVDLRDFAVAVRSHMAANPARVCVLEWSATGLAVGGRMVPAGDDVVPPVPDVPTVRDAVYLGGTQIGDLTVESEQGRIRIPQSLVAHLQQRGAQVAELGAVAGDVYVVAQSERRGEASTDPVVVAPVPVLMWSAESVQAEFHERRRQGGGEVEQLLAALDPATPVPVLLELLDTGVASVRWRVVVHPALPTEVTDDLARTGTRPMRIAVAANPALSPISIDVLARDHDAAVRAAVADDPAAGPDVVRGLADDVDPGVCRRAVANPACPADVLETLVATMPHAVYANPAAPEYLLAEGARSVDEALRAIVGANPATPGRVLTALSREPRRPRAAGGVDQPRGAGSGPPSGGEAGDDRR